MTKLENLQCDGCERHCEYGSFTRTRNGAIYPTIGTKIIQKYTTRDGQTVYIQPGEIRTRARALELARIITMSCKNRIHHNNIREK